MDLDSKRLVVMVPNEAPAPPGRVFYSEDEAWRSYLENPLTAATKAMMSINGDEDSAAALGLLYDYYKVPREKRGQATSGVKPTDPSVLSSNNCGSLEILDHHLQALRCLPVNLSLNNSSMTEHQGSKYGATGFTGGIRRGDGKSEGEVALALVKTETQASMGVSSCAGSYQGETRDQIRMVYDQSCYDLSLSGYLKDEQRSTPDSTYEDPEEGDIYRRSPSSGAEEFHHGTSVSDSIQYSLDASMSLRPGEGPMAYLNRGQFYSLTLSQSRSSSSLHQPRGKVRVSGLMPSQGPGGSPSSNEQCTLGVSELQRDSIVQSVIMVVFGEDKCRDEQLKNWKYWHSRQHTAKQRVLDIADYKESFSTIGNVEEIAYNAVSFTWDISEEAKVFISVNCLSTDFSSQKGVKGMPLIIQIDTYSYNSGSRRPIHRAYSQIKVFCDKGAERKLRDEEKKHLRRRVKGKNGSSGPGSPLKRTDGTLFKTMTDLDTQPVLFIPDVHFGNLQRAGQVFALNTEEVDRNGSATVKRLSCVADEDLCPPESKKSKLDHERKVLLYVRKECDEVFDALMLQSPTLKALMEAISEKYALPVDKMAKVYQKSKKGVLVNMDDNIVQHYSNEDTFTLTIESSADSLRVTLSEI